MPHGPKSSGEIAAVATAAPRWGHSRLITGSRSHLEAPTAFRILFLRAPNAIAKREHASGREAGGAPSKAHKRTQRPAAVARVGFSRLASPESPTGSAAESFPLDPLNRHQRNGVDFLNPSQNCMFSVTWWYEYEGLVCTTTRMLPPM